MGRCVCMEGGALWGWEVQGVSCSAVGRGVGGLGDNLGHRRVEEDGVVFGGGIPGVFGLGWGCGGGNRGDVGKVLCVF